MEQTESKSKATICTAQHSTTTKQKDNNEDWDRKVRRMPGGECRCEIENEDEDTMAQMRKNKDKYDRKRKRKNQHENDSKGKRKRG